MLDISSLISREKSHTQKVNFPVYKPGQALDDQITAEYQVYCRIGTSPFDPYIAYSKNFIAVFFLRICRKFLYSLEALLTRESVVMRRNRAEDKIVAMISQKILRVLGGK